MATTRTPSERWVEAGLQALAEGGPNAVRVEALAKQLGVTKGGFYGFFADREALLAAMLDTWERESIDDVLERVEREGGDPQTRITRAGLLTFSSDRLLPRPPAAPGGAPPRPGGGRAPARGGQPADGPAPRDDRHVLPRPGR